MKRILILLIFLAPFALLLGVSNSDHSNISPRQDYSDIAAQLKPFIEKEIVDKKLPAISVAIVEDQEIVWAQGFGFADPENKTPANADTIYRIGSVSKLFTDIGIMQLVERGEINLDAPITTYLPDFHPKNPFKKPITLRQMMCHRSGLLREPPVGNYFDPTEPSLAQTVNSLNETELVYPPETHLKYSNAAIGVVGYVLEKKSGQPFAAYLKHAVLDPLAMNDSSFEPTPEIKQRLPKAVMWSYDGRSFAAPTFQLGMAPAGSMYSTVIDLGRFASALIAHGKTATGQVLKPQTLEQMWNPQFPKKGEDSTGLGFFLAKFQNHRVVGHGGAIYGFATSLVVLPEDKLGVIAIATKDCANAVTNRIAREALRLIFAQREHKPLTPPASTEEVSPDLGRELAGRYGKAENTLDLKYLSGELTMLPAKGGYQAELRKSGEDLIADDVLSYGDQITPQKDAIKVGEKILRRMDVPKPPPVREEWKGLIGEYGWDHDTLFVFENENRLTLLIEWIEFDPLTKVAKDVYKFPTDSLYDGEKAIFSRDANGEATQVRISGVDFKRRPIGGVSGGTFRIQPQEPVEELRKKALKDHPPSEKGDFRKPDLVEFASLDPTIKLDIRYATNNNFLSTPVYSEARAFMQRPAAEAVVRASQKLKKLGYGLLIHDAYRPWYVTKIFWDATPQDKRIFVADPSQGSRHNRGCAVDLSLYDLKTGAAIEMVGVYDEMSERSYPGYVGGTSLQRWHQELLRNAMESEGFDVYTYEWWHFDYKDWRSYPILNVTFDRVGSAQSAGEPPALHKEYDVIIKNGKIIDGSGNPWVSGDIAIKGEKIAAIGKLDAGSAKRVIDATGLVVSPGFIDMLGQSEEALLIDNRSINKLSQGITTEITGEGASIAPQNKLTIAPVQPILDLYHLKIDWEDLDGYFKRLEKIKTPINIGTYVGAGQVREAVIGDVDRPPTPVELEKMKSLVAQAMKQGAFGISTALIYPPHHYAKTEELIELAKVASQYGGIYATHMRSEGQSQVQAIDEALRIGREAQLPVEIFHLKVSGQPRWGSMPKIVAKIQAARDAGQDVSADMYPYVAGGTALASSVPPWVADGGQDKLLERLKDPEIRKKIKAEMAADHPNWENLYFDSGGASGIMIAGVTNPDLKKYDGKRLAEIAKDQKKPPLDALFDFILADKGQTGALYFIANEKDLQYGLKQPWTSIGLDASVTALDGPLYEEHPHPRAFGSMPRFLGHYVRDLNLLPLEQAIRKITSLPAQRQRLHDRGLLKEGFFADITIFDPLRIRDHATYENANQLSEGVKYVFVNGELEFENGQLTGAKAGKPLRHSLP